MRARISLREYQDSDAVFLQNLTRYHSLRFPSYTETFGQVVLEALASGLPVVGLDADGTRDLVTDGGTGLLLPMPEGEESVGWAKIFASTPSDNSAKVNVPKDQREKNGPHIPTPRPSKASRKLFDELADGYADLLFTLVQDRKLQSTMRRRAIDEGSVGKTWFDAMEALVDEYREAIQIAEAKDAEIAAEKEREAREKELKESQVQEGKPLKRPRRLLWRRRKSTGPKLAWWVRKRTLGTKSMKRNLARMFSIALALAIVTWFLATLFDIDFEPPVSVSVSKFRVSLNRPAVKFNARSSSSGSGFASIREL